MFKEEVKKYPKKCPYCNSKDIQYIAKYHGYVCKKCNTNYIIILKDDSTQNRTKKSRVV